MLSLVISHFPFGGSVDPKELKGVRPSKADTKGALNVALTLFTVTSVYWHRWPLALGAGIWWLFVATIWRSIRRWIQAQLLACSAALANASRNSLVISLVLVALAIDCFALFVLIVHPKVEPRFTPNTTQTAGLIEEAKPPPTLADYEQSPDTTKAFDIRLVANSVLVGDAVYVGQPVGQKCVAFRMQGPRSTTLQITDGHFYLYDNVSLEESNQLLQERISAIEHDEGCSGSYALREL